MEQRIAVLVSTVLGLLLLGVFATVARTAGSRGTADEIAAGAAVVLEVGMGALAFRGPGRPLRDAGSSGGLATATEFTVGSRVVDRRRTI